MVSCKSQADTIFMHQELNILSTHKPSQNGTYFQALISTLQVVTPSKIDFPIPGFECISALTLAFILQTYPVGYKEFLLINYSDSNSDSDSRYAVNILKFKA